MKLQIVSACQVVEGGGEGEKEKEFAKKKQKHVRERETARKLRYG